MCKNACCSSANFLWFLIELLSSLNWKNCPNLPKKSKQFCWNYFTQAKTSTSSYFIGLEIFLTKYVKMPSTYMKTNLTLVYDREENISSTKSNFNLFHGNKYALNRRSFFLCKRKSPKCQIIIQLLEDLLPVATAFFPSVLMCMKFLHTSALDMICLYTMLWTTTSFLSKVHFHNLLRFYVSIFTLWSIPVVHLHLQMP